MIFKSDIAQVLSVDTTELISIYIRLIWVTFISALHWGVLVLLKFEWTHKNLESGATECGVWIGNCNVKVWKSNEHKLHNIWRSVKFQQNEHTLALMLKTLR